MKGPYSIFSALLLATCLAGCHAAKETGNEEAVNSAAARKTRVSEVVIRFASLNISGYSKRIELSDVEQLSRILKKEKIDVFALEGISRYPGVTSRTDILDELSHAAEMQSAFGETIDISGRQNGNAIFSVYPILRSANTHYEVSKSTGFEAALQAIIDCGPREIVFISTLLPGRVSVDEMAVCVKKLGGLAVLYTDNPLIAGGNLPGADAVHSIKGFDATTSVRDDDAQRIWFSSDGGLILAGESVNHTPFGPMIIGHFGIIKKPRP